MSGQGGRYERSMAGMVGAMAVTLLLIIAFVAFRAVNRDNPEYEPEEIEYLPVVQALQQGTELRPAYPPSLPAGWISTQASWDPDTMTWKLNLLDDRGRFVGVRQSTELPEQVLVERYVDEDAERGDTVTLAGTLAGEWTVWTDDTDYALVVEREDDVVLVVGTGGAEQVRGLAESLVLAPVED